MVKFILRGKAELENVTDLEPVDSPEQPFEYQFQIECTRCHTVHSKYVDINVYEKYEMAGSRGEASFVFKCNECKTLHSASVERTKGKITSDGWADLLTIDARGIDFLKYRPAGLWTCVGEKGFRFSDVELDDLEWYDFDETTGTEVSATEIQFDIARG